MKLSAAVLVLFALGALGEVVQDFSTCKQFFMDGVPPVFDSTPGQYKKICQRYNNVYHYATLYDTRRKIPVYSAYQYKRGSDCTVARPESRWKIEPQLENAKNPHMALESTVSSIQNQAINSDYDGSRYDRGHLFPVCHADSAETAESSFTLTNAAPQRCDFNKFWYSKVEDKVRKALEAKDSLRKCLNKPNAYVVTGVVPSKGPELKSVGKGVNVPSHFWTAYSCCDNENCEFGGYIMGKEADDPTAYSSIGQFNAAVRKLYGNEIKVFSGKRARQ